MNFKYIIFAGIILSVLSCRKDTTTWNSDWVVPLINDSLLIKDYVNDSTLAVNSDQSIQVIAQRSLLNLDLSSIIEIPDTSVVQSFAIGIPSLTLAPGSSFIDEIKQHQFSFEEIVLTSARVKSGKAVIRIENPVMNKGVFTISLPGVTKNGIEFAFTETVPGGTASNPGVGDLVLDLTGYTIDMRGESGQLYNLLQSKMKVTTDPNGSSIVLTNQDVFKTKVKFEGLRVDYAKGYFGNVVFSDTTTVDVDELSKIVGGALNVEGVSLQLIVRNGIKVRAAGEVTLFESINYNNNLVALNHPFFGQQFNIEPALGAWNTLTPSEIPFLFDHSSGNMETFIENIGSKYQIGYAIELNPLGNTSSGNDVLYPESSLGIDLNANFPLLIGADELTLRDTFEIDFKNDSKLARLESGKLILNTTNTFPFGASVDLELLDENGLSLKKITSIGLVSPAQLNSAGDAHLPIEEKLEFIIDQQSADLLSTTKSIMVTAVFSSTSFTNNKVFANAALKLLLSSQFKLKSEL
ncbi:hypothetical protein [Brumimicrobium oceani]|uniref:Uncharacterized protein n=1 Tax=Brumimicrobium oceani TaxID=2100725 RepID=A0A2U2X1C0_9FLAO|nr:hypothetical protein [Brumimicrobium oceani]PWH81581.1 hypothetical protein DIT68_14740 [Brumimicrobium oceani]